MTCENIKMRKTLLAAIIVSTPMYSIAAYTEQDCSNENVIVTTYSKTQTEILYLKNECNYLKSIVYYEREGKSYHTVSLDDEDGHISSTTSFDKYTKEHNISVVDEGTLKYYKTSGVILTDESGEMLTGSAEYDYVMSEFHYAEKAKTFHTKASKKAHIVEKY